MNDYYYFTIHPKYNKNDPVFWEEDEPRNKLRKGVVYKSKNDMIARFNRDHLNVVLLLSPVEALIKSRGKMKELK